MNTRELQIVLKVLKRYVGMIKGLSFKPFKCCFLRSELMEIIKWKYGDWSRDTLNLPLMSDKALIELAGDDDDILRFFIEKWEGQSTLLKSRSPEEIRIFFEGHELDDHYLNSKPLELWDEYDYSNFMELILKYGTVEKVYGVYLSYVKHENVSAITTQPPLFFPSYEEAEAELQRICIEHSFTSEELTIKEFFKYN